eukprot:COSAG01_NODE_64234_length_277_cov_0.825843_1_plen_33_part_10
MGRIVAELILTSCYYLLIPLSCGVVILVESYPR